ncbi:MAG: glycosyl hydrolase family 28-related protein [Dysgonomonas sp.]|nr:glycosyl hydrolase family 28-related protein [Dysgonomonas sp.]
MRRIIIVILFILVLNGYQVYGQVAVGDQAYSSIYTTKLDDPLAVYFTPENFNISTDGSTDISDALQEAINKVQETVRYGIVFIPEGTYRISKKINLWKGVRLIGYGKKRPVILLDKNTPGFQEGSGKYMFHFVSDRPWRTNQPIADANAGTFYTGLRNINIKIEEGNPAAIAIRFHAAQHCFLSHMDFHLSSGNIGVEDICNEIEFCRFYGGDYGIKTRKTAPGWQALVIDSYFEKQKKAAIATEEVQLIVVRNHFKNVPTVVSINENRSEQLWISDSRFENINTSAIIVSNEDHPKTQINFENIVCINTPDFLQFRGSGQKISFKDKVYQVNSFTHGLQYADINKSPEIKTSQDIISLKKVPQLVSSDIPMLSPTDTWVNLKTLGAVGDGITDDTEVLKKAIEKYSTIYLPSGHYRVTEPIILKPETNLVGLHPSVTQIILRDSTEAYQGVGTPLPLLETPKGGVNIVSGIGLNTSGINPRAVAAKWMAGEKSMMNDVRFTGGHGTYDLNGRDVRVYNDNRTADGINYRKWDTQNWSLWITDGGGGTFKDIWTPSPYASAGLYISNTNTQGRIYIMSIEHHVRNEVIFDNISNWRIFGLQLEEESGEGPYCLPLDIRNSNNLMFANTFAYRVSRVATPYPYAVHTSNSNNLLFKGLRAYTWTKYLFDNTLYDVTSETGIRSREIALLKISDNVAIKSTDTDVRKLADGFDFIDGATVDKNGNPYFIDYKWQRIYRWNIQDEKIELICEMPVYPVSLSFDTEGNLLVVTRFVQVESIFNRGNVSVIAMNPDNPIETIRELKAVPFSSVDMNNVQWVVYQASRYRIEHNVESALMAEIQNCYIAPDGVTIVPDTPDLAQTYSLKKAQLGEKIYVSSNAAQRTYSLNIDKQGRFANPQLFTNDGEIDVLEAANGDIYISSGNILVYDKDGSLKKYLEIPERPTSIVLGGKNKDILFVCARGGFYSIKI